MSLKDTCVSTWEAFPVSLPQNASITERINLGGLRLFSIVMPTEWTSASLTFQMSPDGETAWSNIKDSTGGEITAIANAGDCIVLDPSLFAAFQYIRIRSGTIALPITQESARSLRLLLRRV